MSDHIEFGIRCEMYYAFVQDRPQRAIHLRGEKSAARFKNDTA